MKELDINNQVHSQEHNHEHGDCHIHQEHNHEHGDCHIHQEHNHEHHHHEEFVDHDFSKPDFKFKIIGLDCANCALKVERAIANDKQFSKCSINYPNKTVMVNVNGIDSLEAKELIEKISNEVEGGITIKEIDYEVKNNHQLDIIKLVIGLIAFIASLVLEHTLNFNPFYIMIITYIIVGYDVILKSIKNISKGQIFDENFLMTIATLGAIYVRSYEEAVGVMLFYGFGELAQDLAVEKSRGSIASLMDIKVDYTTRIREGKEELVKPEALAIGDVIVVKPGEGVGADGVVINGSSSLDTSSLTGESLPREVHEGDSITNGCINLNGLLQIEVTKTYEDSTVAKILELVENASSHKSVIESFITRFAKVYTPIVCFLAVALVFGLYAFNGFTNFNEYLTRGCTFLVISCPCALVVSIPLTVFAGIGKASRIGALVKGGNYLELLCDIDTIIMDKTGTITKGNFSVTAYDNEETLKLAAFGESYSNHPIAKSIINKYKKVIDKKLLSNYEEIAGKGIKVNYLNKELLVGNKYLLSQNKIDMVENNNIGTIIYVAYDHCYIGSLTINDEIKPTSAKAVNGLKEEGIMNVVMLTGDKKASAEKIANEVNIDQVYAELLPQNKVEILEDYLSKHKVAFVGDGINDAPSLMRSDIGISMGGVGSDAAIEASDIVLMNDDLSLIPSLIKVSKKTRKICYQNITFALGIKLIVLITSAFGLTGMWLGVFADTGVALLAILNALRVNR